MRAAEPPKPSRARHLVIVFAVTLAIITYIDRVCISQAAPYPAGFRPLASADGLRLRRVCVGLRAVRDSGRMDGRLARPAQVALRIVTWWSICTAAMGWMWSLTSLIATNFLFGMGEAGCFPNLTKVFTTWLPLRERVRARA